MRHLYKSHLSMQILKYGIGVLILSFLCLNTSIAQKEVKRSFSKLYNEIISEKSSFTAFNLKLKTVPQPLTLSYATSLKYAEFYQFENLMEQRSISDAPNIIEIEVPFRGKIYSCIFKRNHLKSANYKLSTSKTSKESKQKSIYYKGIVVGQPRSWATLAYVNDTYKILIAHENGNIEVNHIGDSIYAIYDSRDQQIIPDFACEYVDRSIKNTPATSTRVGSDCLELYIECDFQSYVDNGSSVANTEAWAMSIMNDVSTIYAAIDIPLVVAEIFVWNSNDPYINETSLTGVRNEFVSQIQNNYTGRVAQLFSTRPLAGGLAFGIGGLCGEFPDFPGPYSIATELSTTFDPFPNFSFTVNVVSHELGHVLGARHTHACVWGPNGNTQIDDCGNVFATNNGDTPEGTGCYDVDNPILPMNGGTIMSFCDLAGGGIDLSNGFGTEVGDFIFEQYNTAVCATGEVCASIPPSNDDCANAKQLSLAGECFYFSYDNILATPSGVADPSCGTPGIGQDVWFTITPSNTDVLLNFSPVTGGVEDAIITAYSGTCGNLSEIACEVANDEEIQLKLSGLTPDAPIYIRIIEQMSDEEGSFLLCAIDETLPCHPAFDALIDFYNATNGANWTDNSGWVDGAAGTNCTPCEWFGITCDNLNNIIEIDMPENNLIGTIPASLSALTYLRTIRLLVNDLSGDFPDIWMDMEDLELLDLSNNQFTGNMPASLGNLLNLNTLYIENNNMTGSLLAAIGNLPRLNIYWARDNDFSGCFPGTYLNLCDIQSITFDNNAQLPNGGELDFFCLDGTGGDADEDGFCLGSGINDDCADDDNTIFPNAPELCDGKDNDCDGQFDEGSITTNTWLPTGGGDWQVDANWSTGLVPQACEDVIIPAAANGRTITIPVSTDAFGRSLTVGTNSLVVNDGNLAISGSDEDGIFLDVNSSLENNGFLDIYNIQNFGLTIGGLIQNYGTINVSNLSTSFEVFVRQEGTFENNTGSQVLIGEND